MENFTNMQVDTDKGGYRQINKSLNICAFDDFLNGQFAHLPHLPDVEQITVGITSLSQRQNPGKFTYQGTNTYVIGTGTYRIMIDTGGGEPAWARLVASTLSGMGITLSHVLLTHWHGDHTGGVPDLLHLYPHLENSVYKNRPERNQQDVEDRQIFRVDGATIRALHVPGHSVDHMCFILEEEMAMFTGDNILGHGTTVVEDLGIFMDSLRTMHAQRCGIGYSAHGITITDLPAKIQCDLRSRLRRERQVMGALDRLRAIGTRSAAVKEIVAEVYGTSVDEATRTLALEPFIDEVLRKLAGDCRVGFQIRGRKKTWYSVEEVQQSEMRQAHGASGLALTDVRA